MPPERFHQVSYEDLLLTPEHSIGEICDFLGVKYDSQMLDFYNDETVYSGYSEDHATLKKPLITDKVAGWRRDMRESDIAMFESISAPHLRQYGYPVTGKTAGLSNMQHLYYEWLDHPPRKAAAMMRNRQGHSEEFRLLWMRTRLFSRYLLNWPRQ